MDTHTTNGSQAPKPGKRITHNLTINLPKGLLPVSHKDLLQILPIDQLTQISQQVANGFRFVALTRLPYLVPFPQDLDFEYGDKLYEGSKLRLCLLFVKREYEVEILRAYAYLPALLSKEELSCFMETFLATSQMPLLPD